VNWAENRNIRPWMKGEIEMKTIEFVTNYESYVKEIEAVVRPEFKPIIQKILEIDPHDLITPDSYFEGENDAKGLVWKIFMKKAKKDGLI
jgi:hypothetical protein